MLAWAPAEVGDASASSTERGASSRTGQPAQPSKHGPWKGFMVARKIFRSEHRAVTESHDVAIPLRSLQHRLWHLLPQCLRW